MAIFGCNEVRRPPHRPGISPAAATERFRAALIEAGGTQIRIKPRAHHARLSANTLEALVATAAFPEVVSHLHEEAKACGVSLVTTQHTTANGLRTETCNAVQGGRTILQIRVREISQLLRAAIVIDDMGSDLDAAHKLLALDYPLTLSVLPYRPYTQEVAQEAHRAGHEVMLHLPMEPEDGAHISPGEGAIRPGMSAAQITQVVRSDLASVPFVVGVNNHMGSRATQDAALMADVMQVLAARRLYFIDSRTTPRTRALDEARRLGVPAFYRAVFLDDTASVPYTLTQLRTFRHLVERNGVALAIGHPHPTTIEALAEFLPELERDDIELVAPSQIVRLPEVARLNPPGAVE